MAPNVSHLAFLTQQPVALSTPIKAAPVTKDFAAASVDTAAADSYWAWESPAQHNDLFSANHITANLSRASATLSEQPTDSANDSYWAENDFRPSASQTYWNDQRAAPATNDAYWHGL